MLPGTSYTRSHAAGTREFDEHSIPGGLDDAAAVFGNLRVAQLAPDRAQGGESALFVRLHQPRVTGNVSRENRGEPAFDTIGVHR
jgi:hypothetical protein